MKLIIVDGPDNTGKSTVVNHIVQLLTEFGGVAETHINVIHSVTPDGNRAADKIFRGYNYNTELINQLIDASDINTWDYVILDRSWISEFVYSQLYRNLDKETAENYLAEHEHHLSLQYKNYADEVYMIMLTSSDAAFLKNHEDGESLSIQTDSPLDMMEKEIELFNDAFNLTDYNHKIKVNVNHPNNREFKTFEDIMDEINKELF